MKDMSDVLSPTSRARNSFFFKLPWGSRPRLYADVRFADSVLDPEFQSAIWSSVSLSRQLAVPFAIGIAQTI